MPLVRLPVLHRAGVNQHSPAEAKIASSSARCFMDAQMFTRVASKAARLAGPAIHRHVVMNGSRASAKNQGSNVPNASSPPAFSSRN